MFSVFHSPVYPDFIPVNHAMSYKVLLHMDVLPCPFSLCHQFYQENGGKRNNTRCSCPCTLNWAALHHSGKTPLVNSFKRQYLFWLSALEVLIHSHMAMLIWTCRRKKWWGSHRTKPFTLGWLGRRESGGG